MITYSVAACLLAYLRGVHAQATICLATYGGVATSVPPPGRSFIVQVSSLQSPLSPFDPGDDPGSGFLDSTGQVQALCQRSSPFLLSGGLLYSGSDRVSVAPGVPFMRFEASEYVEAIDGIFAVDEAEGKMVWNNEAFENGTARFCADSTGALYGVFLGPLPGNCTPTELSVQNPDSCSSLARPLQVLPTLLGNQTSLVVPPATALPATRLPLPHLQPQIQPPLADPLLNLNTSSNASVLPYPILLLPLTSNSPSIPTASPSVPSSVVTISTLDSPSTTSAPSSEDPIAQASAIIRQNRFTVWCTDVLGYTLQPQVTTTVIVSSVVNTSVVVTQPTSDTTTIVETLTSTLTQGIPPFDVTVITTPTVTETVTSVDEVVVEETTTVVGASLGARKMRGLPYQPGKPSGFAGAGEQPRLADLGSSTTTSVAASSTGSASSLSTTSTSNRTSSSSSSSASNSTLPVVGYVTAAFKNNPPAAADLNTTTTAIITNATTSSSLSVTFSSSNATPTTPTTTIDLLRTITTPVILQTFDPSVVTAACSENAVPPKPLPNATTSITTTVVYTTYLVEPYATVTTTDVVVPATVTVENTNDVISTTVTESAGPVTDDVTLRTTETTTVTSSVVTFPSNVPALILTSAVPIGPFSPDGAPPPDLDDATFEVTLPFQMRMFDHSSETVWVSSNGILSLDNGTREYDNECLPSIGNYDYPHDPVPPYSAFPFWDDTYIYAGQPQGIYYQFGNGAQSNITTTGHHPSTDDAPATNVTFEYYLSHCCGNGDGGNEKYYHYTVFYDGLAPGIFTYRYYQISENGASATVGMQDFVANTAITYSCNQAVIGPGLEVVVNSIIGTVQHRNFSLPG